MHQPTELDVHGAVAYATRAVSHSTANCVGPDFTVRCSPVEQAARTDSYDKTHK